MCPCQMRNYNEAMRVCVTRIIVDVNGGGFDRVRVIVHVMDNNVPESSGHRILVSHFDR